MKGCISIYNIDRQEENQIGNFAYSIEVSQNYAIIDNVNALIYQDIRLTVFHFLFQSEILDFYGEATVARVIDILCI